MNGTKKHDKDAETKDPDAPKRPRSPPTRANDVDETGKASKRRTRQDTEDKSPPPPFPDMEEEEVEGEGGGEQQNAEATAEGSPLPTLETPARPAKKKKGKKNKKRKLVINRKKELTREDFENNLEQVAEQGFATTEIFDLKRARLAVGSNAWLEKPTRVLKSGLLMDRFKTRLHHFATDDDEAEENAEIVEEEEEEEQNLDRSLPRDVSNLRDNRSSLLGEHSGLLRSVSGMSGLPGGGDSMTHRRNSPPRDPLPDDPDEFDPLKTIMEEDQPPALDVSLMPPPAPPQRDGSEQNLVATEPSSQDLSSASSSLGILSLASSDNLDPEALDDRIDALTECGRVGTTFAELAGDLGGRRAAALAFYNLLVLEAEGKVQSKQDEAFGTIEIFSLLNR